MQLTITAILTAIVWTPAFAAAEAQFSLYKGDSFDGLIAPLSSIDNAAVTIDLYEVGKALTVVADITAETTTLTQVEMKFDGELITTKWSVPYSLAGDWEGWYNYFEPLSSVGVHVVSIVPYDENWMAMETQSITLEVIDSSCIGGHKKLTDGSCATTGIVSGLTLYQGDAQDKKIRDLGLEKDQNIEIIEGEKYTIVAETDGSSLLTKVEFFLDGKLITAKHMEPYSVNGDWKGQGWYNAFEPLTVVGTYTLSVLPFDENWHPLPATTFTLQVSCAEGYETDENGRCADINECEDPDLSCFQRQYGGSCVNTPGSHECYTCLRDTYFSRRHGRCVHVCYGGLCPFRGIVSTLGPTGYCACFERCKEGDTGSWCVCREHYRDQSEFCNWNEKCSLSEGCLPVD